MSGSTREGRGGAEVRQKQPDQLIKSILELQLPFRRRKLQRIMENGNAHQDYPINHIFMPDTARSITRPAGGPQCKANHGAETMQTLINKIEPKVSSIVRIQTNSTPLLYGNKVQRNKGKDIKKIQRVREKPAPKREARNNSFMP
jgi:hypothetical protein